MGVLDLRIKELRKQRRLTQEEVSNRLRIGRTTYLGYENGKIGIPAKRLGELADMFGVSIDYISGKSEHKTIYDVWDSKHDSDGLRRELIVREFAKQDLKGLLQIALDTLGNGGNDE